MADPLDESKKAIRTTMRKAVAALTPEQRAAASAAACQRLIALEPFAHATTVMLYMPLANEVDVTAAALKCFRAGHTVCVPKVDWDRHDMHPVEVTSFDDRVLDCDSHGARTPKSGRLIMHDAIDVVIVPALAYDPQGNRLGRGAGYYDRFLAKLRPGVTSIGVVFDQQIVDGVPTNQRDMAVDIVVTDRRVTMAKAARTKK
jgi:5-formyltetrahydrofolate cyclo-ligase